ncbi:hypothetical protein ACFOGJ_20930 [Marinibaculum pumilum]|uniref:Antitoxin VbhA domain-containing protein n=1 Tax=Marinibaculum pumilum TaxID=1766165 RepID=A0ABV7L500_9PROT
MMPTPEEIARRLELFEQGLANAAVEGQHLDPSDELFARSLIEKGLSVEEQATAMTAHFEANPLRGRRVGRQ